MANNFFFLPAVVFCGGVVNTRLRLNIFIGVKKVFAVLCCLGFIVLAFADVNGFVDAGRKGVLLFGRNVMPVLFPFFFVSGLLVEIGFFKGFRKFGVAAPVFALSLLSGYPTGARLLADLYKRGEITRQQAIRTATYTSTCSPIFIIATLGACFYQSVTAGVLVFAAHTIGAVLSGVLFRGVRFKEDQSSYMRYVAVTPGNDMAAAISSSLYSAIQNIFAVGGLVVVFFVAANMIPLHLLGTGSCGVFISGLLEMTNGVFRASVVAPTSLALATAIVTFGGMSVAMQGFVFMSSFKMPFWFYLLYKVTHTVFAVLICLILAAVLI